MHLLILQIRELGQGTRACSWVNIRDQSEEFSGNVFI